ncbi:MAG: DUF2807 domain-containing protein [Bacteroidales bacterium]|nr:DUF2807 domain-containing protein [Bacteroidales bacterium]
MKKQIILTAFIISVLMLTGFSNSPATDKETRDVKGFTKINFGVPGNLYINFGPEYKVVLEGDRDILDNILTQVSGDKLIIKPDSWRLNIKNNIIVYITLPAISGLGVSGSGEAKIKEPVKSENLNLSVSGSGKLFTANVVATVLNCGISGSGDIIIQGGGDIANADIEVSGSGNYRGEMMKIGSADISISGSGSCVCNVTESLKASVSGSGNVTYIGSPKVDARVSGSGRVRSK